MALEDFRKMGGDDRGRIDHRIAGHHGFFALAVGDPERRQVEGRFARLDAADLRVHVARIHRQEVIHQDLRRRHLIALDEQGVLAGLELEIVTQVQGGDDHTHVQSELTADGADTGEQVAALLLVHQRDEAVAHFELQSIQGQQGLHFFRRVRRGALALALALALGAAFGFLGVFFVAGRDAGGDEDQTGKDEEGQGRQARHQRKDTSTQETSLRARLLKVSWARNSSPILASEAAREDQQARAGGHDDGRDGGDQTVTDGQQGIGGEGRVPVHVPSARRR